MNEPTTTNITQAVEAVLAANPNVWFTPSAAAKKAKISRSYRVWEALVELEKAGKAIGYGNGTWRKWRATAAIAEPTMHPRRDAPEPVYGYDTIERALEALEIAYQDTRNDHGEEALRDGWPDLVHAIANYCSPDVRAELLRSNGLQERR